jgi:hypothetical protein
MRKYFFIKRNVTECETFYTIMFLERYWLIRISRLKIVYED